MDLVTKREQQRFLYLEYLYKTTDGNTSLPVSEEDIAKALGLTDKELEQTSQYLSGENLITYCDRGVKLTHLGMVEIEAKLKQPNKPTLHFPINMNNIFQIGPMTDSLIQQGTVGSTQSASFSSTDLQVVSQLIRDLKANLPDLGLDQDDAQTVESDITTIEAQVVSPRPKAAIIKECLHSIKNIAEGLTGSMAAAGIIEGIKKLLGG